MAFTYMDLSGSTDGRRIKVTQTATAGNTIHTAHATSTDIITIDAYNDDTVARVLTIEFGGVTDPDDLILQTIQPQAGLEIIIPGRPLTNSLVVGAFASVANVITIGGEVWRVS